MKKRGKVLCFLDSKLRVITPFFWLYLFIFGIALLKKTTLSLSSSITPVINTLINTSPLKALSAGWFLTSIFQSSSIINTISITLASHSLLPIQTVMFIMMGAIIGTAITTLIIALLVKADKRRDFRHGFEISVSTTIYNILLVIIFFILEVTTHLFSSIAQYLDNLIFAPHMTFIPDFLSLITDPLVNLFSSNPFKFFNIIIALLIMILSIRSISNSVICLLGGEDKTKKFIHKYFKSKTRAFFLGFILTAMVFSASITVGILVPLVVSRLLNLQKVIPFIIGAEIGTMTDLFIVALVMGKSVAVAIVLTFLIMLIFGALIFLPNTKLIFNITKYTSKHIFHISKKRAILYLIGFITIPLILLILL